MNSISKSCYAFMTTPLPQRLEAFDSGIPAPRPDFCGTNTMFIMALLINGQSILRGEATDIDFVAPRFTAHDHTAFLERGFIPLLNFCEDPVTEKIHDADLCAAMGHVQKGLSFMQQYYSESYTEGQAQYKRLQNELASHAERYHAALTRCDFAVFTEYHPEYALPKNNLPRNVIDIHACRESRSIMQAFASGACGAGVRRDSDDPEIIHALKLSLAATDAKIELIRDLLDGIAGIFPEASAIAMRASLPDSEIYETAGGMPYKGTPANIIPLQQRHI